MRRLIECIKERTILNAPGYRTKSGPNGTTLEIEPGKRDRRAAASFWTFSYPSDVEDEGDETSKACWHNCRLQIGYDASHACTGDSLKQYADGVYYCEVDLLNETCELKRVDGDSKGAIPPHDFANNKVNLFVGIVKEKKQTYSINCIPVAYKYV